MAGMDLPPEVLATVAPRPEEPAPEPEPQATAEQPQPEPEPEPEPEPPPPAAAPPEGRDGEEEHVPEEWPQSAKARVREEAEKKRKWKSTAEGLQQQLTQQSQAPQQPVFVEGQDPLQNVLDLGTLARIERDWQEIMDFAEDNPDGAYEVSTWENGKPIKKDYTAADILEMKRKARPILRAVPQRKQYLGALANNAAEAQQAFPEMFKDGSELNIEASQIIGAFPELRRSPEWMLWLGDAIAGRKARLAKDGKTQGGKPLSASAQAILQAPKVKPAPGAIKARSHGTRESNGDVDANQAREEFAARGYSDEAMTDYVTKLRLAQNRGIGPRQKTLT